MANESANNTTRLAPYLTSRSVATSSGGNSALERFDAIAPPEHFGAAAPIVALWQKYKNNNDLPGWGDFGFTDFDGHHASIGLSEITDSAPSPRFRIFGSNMCEAHDGDYTGKLFSDFADQAVNEIYLNHFRTICEQSQIGRSLGDMIKPGREHCSYICVELPLKGRWGKDFNILHYWIWTDD